LLAALLSQGCAGPGARLQYLVGEDKTIEHYRDFATSIEYPTESESRESDPNLFRAPRRITSLEEVSQRHIKLDECIKMALSNATILRDDQSFGSPGNALLANPSRVASVYDAAIQDTSFLFGNRGVDAALADFDPIFTSNLQAGLFYTYLRTTSTFLCPSDNSRVRKYDDTPLPGAPRRTRSYNLSQSVSCDAAPTYRKLTLIFKPSPANLFTFIDTHEDAILDSVFGTPLPDSGYGDRWFDIPGSRHGQAANLGFADGHVERWKWKHPKTGDQFFTVAEIPNDRADLRRLQEHIKTDWEY
jgi:prepilin-type processing-associated H-X9-DG protein